MPKRNAKKEEHWAYITRTCHERDVEHFCRTGHPAAKDQPAWPYTIETRATMQIDANCKVVDDPYRQERVMLQHLDA
jgi:carboxylesterase type B